MIKGAKKAIVRVPHRIYGSKSIEDRVILEWTKDFVTADAALDVTLDETKKFVGSWRDVLNDQKSIAETFKELYTDIQEENAYRETQQTPQSCLDFLAGFENLCLTVKDDIEPELARLENTVKARIKEVKECIDGVQKALKKREHKKVDFDRISNMVEKLARKHDLSEKEEQQLQKHEAELTTAMELFQKQDEKVKVYIPRVLNTISEFLNPFTANIYLTELTIVGNFRKKLLSFAQAQGLLSSKNDPQDYGAIADDWESRFVKVQAHAEQGIAVIRTGKAVLRPMNMPSKTTKQKAENAWLKSIDATGDLAHRALERSKHISRSSTKVAFSSPSQGMFRSEADILNSPAVSSPSLSSHQRIMSSESVRSFGGNSPSLTSAQPGSDDFDFSGKSHSRIRAFSSSSARALSPGGSEYTIPPKGPNDEYVEAQYTFQGDQPGDVSFRAGDKIRVLDHGDELDKNWWFGETIDGRFGLFPSNYIVQTPASGESTET